MINKTLACPLASKDICEDLVIRNMKDGEEENVMNVFKESFGDVYNREREFWRDLIDIDPTIVLVMNDEIIGVSSVRTPQLTKNQSISWIDLIAVDPKYRRMEFGRILLNESENLMDKMGAKKGRLFTEVNNTEAVSFYSKHNWEVAERTEWGYKHAHRLTMEKIL